ncbi:UvrB/UvrC motif-containing protein [Metabacillus sp. 84]|uniref:UvrB/UvrC motif-containing protein n=1 Tax=Metabacillus sp. 84 TaxID=3404705 RepID=UPI003CF8A7FD
MVCQECHERPATFHFTKVINGEKAEVHICEQCAKENSNMMVFGSDGGFSINSLLSGLLNFETKLAKSDASSMYRAEEIQHCPRCGMTYRQFGKAGRFGCSECYKTFQNEITPILRKVHSGNTVHGGKIPKRIGGSIHLQKRMEDLKKLMQHHIAQEEFEKAAELRDEIKEIVRQINMGRGEEA